MENKLNVIEAEKREWDEKASKFLEKTSNWSFRGSYDDAFTSINILKPIHTFFKDIETAANILDYGCGNGWTALLLATRVQRVYAFDISIGQIRVLQKYVKENRFSNIVYSVADGSHIPFPDDSFQYIFGNAILHHIPLRQCLPEIARVLKPGGRAAFCEPFGKNHAIKLIALIKANHSKKDLHSDSTISYSHMATFKKYFSRVEFIKSSQTSNQLSLKVKSEDLREKFTSLKRNASYLTILLEK